MVKDPFFCMNLICPSTSYDVNVEPAKDDILFVNADYVIGIFECFLKSVYGELRTPPTVSTQARSSNERPRGFDVLLARKSQAGSNIPEQLVHNAQPVNRNTDNVASMPSASKPAQSGCDGLAPLNISQDGSVQDCEEAELNGRNFRANHPDAVAVPVAVFNRGSKSVNESSTTEQRRGWQRNMYGVDEDEVNEPHRPLDDDSQLQDSQGSDEEAGLRDAGISNPWAFAKLNAPVRRSNIAKGAVANVESNNQLLTPGRQVGELGKAAARQVHELLKSSDAPNFGLPTPARDKGDQATNTTLHTPSSPEPFPFPEKYWGKSDRETASSKHTSPMNSDRGALDSWVQKPMGCRSVTIHSAGPLEDDIQNPQVPVQNPTHDFVSARVLPMGTPLGAIPERAFKSTRNRAPGRKTRSDLNKPFISPVNDPSRVWFDMEPMGKGIIPQPARAKSVIDSVSASNGIRLDKEDQDSVTESSPTRSISLVHPDLAATMEYEIRKQAALQHWKANQRSKAVTKVPSSEEVPSRSSAKTSPHQNRYSRAVANLHSSDGGAASLESQLPCFEPGDPRAYLLRPQEHDEMVSHDIPNDASKRPRSRKKTGLLPLETIPSDSSTRDLILTLGREELGLKARLRPSTPGTVSDDEYVSRGTTVGAFSSCTIHQIRAWEAKVRELVGNLWRGTEEDDGVADERTDFLRLDIWTSLQTHRAALTLLETDLA